MISQEDRNEFINAGVYYIYELDEYQRSSVFYQVAKEFDEILELNNTAVLAERSEYIGVGRPSDYLNRLIETDEGSVVAGIRHLGSNKNKPFIFIWPSFKIRSINKFVKSITPYFEVFKPEMICYWSRPDCNDSDDKVIQQRFIAEVAKMGKNDLTLSKPENYYEWYKSEYTQFHKENPDFINRIQANSKDRMDASLDKGLLYCLFQNEERIGLIAGDSELFLEKPTIYLNEIMIARNHRGKGNANKLLASFVNTLDADYFICDIDSENTRSTNTALQSGQTVFSQEIFVKI